jgi:hypothetical protein
MSSLDAGCMQGLEHVRNNKQHAACCLLSIPSCCDALHTRHSQNQPMPDTAKVSKDTTRTLRHELLVHCGLLQEHACTRRAMVLAICSLLSLRSCSVRRAWVSSNLRLT